MPQTISTFPDVRSSTQTVTLDSAQYQLTLVYLLRMRGWYMTLATLDGTALISGRRLSPEAGPFVGLDLVDGPPGTFYVRGDDDYERPDLGKTLRLLYYSRAELQAAKAIQDAADDDDDGVITF